MEAIFRPADILLPADADMRRWSVVACDQFSSQPEYWDELDSFVADAPSTLRMILPEAYLERRDQFEEAEKIGAVMRGYLTGSVFRALPDSFVYVERTLAGGAVRRGLVGAIDLEAYDYSRDSLSPVRATEGTVPERLPPRVQVRRSAPLEMPHIMVFLDDKTDGVLGALREKREALPLLYDFDLNCGGGHLTGRQVSGEAAKALLASLDELELEERDKCAPAAPVIFAIGDGNHSLAAAKNCWEEVKAALPPEAACSHPARFALVELVNIHDDGIGFEPIHRVLFGTKAEGFPDAAKAYFQQRALPDGSGHELRLITAEGEEKLRVKGLTIGQTIGAAEEFCQRYVAEHGGSIDYIHGDDIAEEMGRREGGAALLLPRMEKSELFPSIVRSGPFPKKSFSIGHAADKRYYLECRRLK